MKGILVAGHAATGTACAAGKDIDTLVLEGGGVKGIAYGGGAWALEAAGLIDNFGDNKKSVVHLRGMRAGAAIVGFANRPTHGFEPGRALGPGRVAAAASLFVYS